MLQGFNLLRKRDFSSIVLKAQQIESDLDKELKNTKVPNEIDKATLGKIRDLIDYIADDELLGEERFNSLTEHLRPDCHQPHIQGVKINVDVGPSEIIIKKLLGGQSASTNLFSSISEAKT